MSHLKALAEGFAEELRGKLEEVIELSAELDDLLVDDLFELVTMKTVLMQELYSVLRSKHAALGYLHNHVESD